MLDPNSGRRSQGRSISFGQVGRSEGASRSNDAGESYGNQFDAFMAKELTVQERSGIENTFNSLLNKQADYLIIDSIREKSKLIVVD